jgi:hypothetical protein
MTITYDSLSFGTPAEFPEMFSKLLLGGVYSPGVVTLTGHDRGREWDIQKPSGSEGATSKYGGESLAEFQASFFLADTADFEEWPGFQRLVESTTRGAAPVALPVFHPVLAANRITDVVCGSMGGMVFDSRGGATIQIKFLEYNPPKPKPPARATARGGGGGATGTAGSGAPGAPAPAPYDPNAAAKAQLNSLMEEASKP